jgi:transketolase
MTVSSVEAKPTMENVFSTEKAKGARDLVAPALRQLVEERPDVVVMSADLGASIDDLRRSRPDRYFDFGIAETNTISVAAGMAAGGLKPYILSMAPFGMVKCAEQIRTDAAYTRMPIRIVAKLAGVGMGYFGPSHHANEDIAIGRAIPNLTMVAPADANSTMALLRSTADVPGPVYLRLSSGITREIYPADAEFEFGKMCIVRPGSDVTIIATGVGVQAALGAAETLASEGIEVEVIDAVYLKPFDEAAVIEAIGRTGRILTVEEHSVIGGLGSAVADVIARNSTGGSLLVHGLPDEELLVAAQARLLDHYGLTPAGVVAKVRELIAR